MPATPKILLIIIAIFEALVGLALIVAPANFIASALPGAVPGPDGIMLAHLSGTALVSLAALAWLGRNLTEPAALRPVLGALLIYNVLAVVNLFYQTFTFAPGSIAPAIVHLILTGGLIHYWRKAA